MRTRVYVSSTAKDLALERKAVIDSLVAAGFEPVYFESQGAQDLPLPAYCCNDVRSCAVYVLLLAWRYGHRPPKDVGNPDDLGITEMEYRAARDAKKKVLAYVRPEDSRPPAPAAAAERDDIERAVAFRERLRRERTPWPFADKTALAPRVLEDLHLWRNETQAAVKGAIPRDAFLACDREPHATAARLHVGQRVKAFRPAVLLVHGAKNQGHHYFAERFARIDLPLLARGLAPTHVPLDWMDGFAPAETASLLHESLWSTLSGGVDVLSDTEEPAGAEVGISSRNAPFVASVEVPTDTWTDATRDAVREYAASWMRKPLDRLRAPGVVVLTFRRTGAAFRDELETIAKAADPAGGVVVVKELDDVDENAVRSWTQRARLHDALGIVDAFAPLRSLFETKSRWPMEDLMDELTRVYAESGAGVAGRTGR